MTSFLGEPHVGSMVRLSGTMSGYQCTRSTASFVFTESDQRKMGVIAIGAALVGLSGQAASVVGYASDMEEAADYLEFDLAGLPVKGWVWRSPFHEGDVVNVAAEWNGEYYEAYGIARPADKMIALYPHCSRAKRRHVKNAVKWWARWNLAFLILFAALVLSIGGFDLLLDPAFVWVIGGMAIFWTIMFISLTRQFMPFVRLSEKIFRVLDLSNPSNIDLAASSKRQRTDDDTPELGTFYFRY